MLVGGFSLLPWCLGRRRIESPDTPVSIWAPVAGIVADGRSLGDDSPVTADGIGLVGRAVERQALDNVLASVRGGMSAVLVVRGVAGIGKTALLNDVVGAAHDLRVLRVTGLESEMNFRFAALHQLVIPLLDGVTALPAPQKDALLAAFGMTDGDAPDRFLVALAALTLLTSAATGGGIVLVVDDAQWLDPESEAVLAFVARRLLADKIGVFVSVRVPTDRDLAIDVLPSLELGPLEPAAAAELMASIVDGAVDERVRRRVMNDAQGNPLAIVELTRELTPHALDAALLPRPLSLDRRLEARFLRQIRELPPATQRLLLTAAAEPTGNAALLWRAGATLDFNEGAAKEAEASDLLSFRPTISFRHPLIREAIYHGASDDDRRRTHAALASVIDVAVDPDRHAWHRAAAALAPDEDIAAELQSAAERARQRGGHASTAALLKQAAELTPDPTQRGLRLLQAAAADLIAGALPRAEATLELARPMLSDPSVSAQARRLEAAIQFLRCSGSQAASTMLQAATELHEIDPHVARETAIEALQVAVLFGQYGQTHVLDVARAAGSLRLSEGEVPNSSDLLLDGLAEYFAAGGSAARPLLRRGIDALLADPGRREFHRRLSFGMWAAFAAGDNDAQDTISTEYVATAREGALAYLPEALHYRGRQQMRCGTLTRAGQIFAEESDFEQMHERYDSGIVGQLTVLCWQGDEAAARQLAAKLTAIDRERSLGWTTATIGSALVALELALGNYSAAVADVPDDWRDNISVDMFTAADLIEARVRNGTPESAMPHLAWLQDRAMGTQMPLELGLLARSRALVSDDRSAETYYQEALTLLGQSAGDYHRARAQLVYGEWLRRQKRRRDAREQLRSAVATFEQEGAIGFADRARGELIATGERARKRVDETRDDLTPQEMRIALLAVEGDTNPEIAAKVFLSVSTVEYHLSNVYRKLGVSSRRALALSSRLNKPRFTDPVGVR